MNRHTDSQRIPEFPGHDELLHDAFSPGASDPYRQMQYPAYFRMPHKRKWIAGLLSFFIPGTGQFYLGLMHRGLFIMLLIVANIIMIVTLTTQSHVSIPLVTLFSLILPVIYFYNIFDALQSTDNVNRLNEIGGLSSDAVHAFHDPLQRLMRGSNLGVLLITAGLLFFLLSAKPHWMEGLFDLMGSYIGSVVLIAAGLVLFLLETKKK